MIGGSSLINIAIGVVRTKAMALILGPSGVGLAGLYGSIADVSTGVAGMGVNSSGVRQIAEAVGSSDKERIARTAAVLRRTSVALGVLGTVLVIALSRQISQFTFGTPEHVTAVCLLSFAVLLRVIADGQCALIQGMRHIADLAKITVAGALTGTLVGIPIVYVFREHGIAPALVAVAASTLVASWWFRRKIRLPHSWMSASQARRETAALLKVGAAFMASAMMMMGSAYAIRIMILRGHGFEATGLYQSAWTLGGLYVGFILQAMGADFYPRLTAVAQDDAACNLLVNQQARIGLLLAGPGVIATVTAAPLIMAVFYSSQFAGAVPILRWICLGMTLRVINWPMGFILLAKGRQNLFFWSDLAWTVSHVVLVVLSLGTFGLHGAGFAFFASYVLHGGLTYFVVHRISGFSWSKNNLHSARVFLFTLGAVLLACLWLPTAWAGLVGLSAFTLTGAYSLRTLLKLTGSDSQSDLWQRLSMRFSF
jgi:PST family polysaccharide transporter